MKLIHCADLHLDSPMESNLPAQKARERRGEILTAFAKLVELADENRASAILISGDLFDSNRTARKTEKYVLDLIAAHPDLYFFYLAGNHDSGKNLIRQGELPKNLLTFGDGWTSYDFGEAVISGSEHPDPDELNLSEGRVNIVMLHGQARDSSTDCGDVIPFRKYQNKYIDYMALGHLHSYQTATLDNRGIACYSGCLEGRGFDECGQKGYVLLDVENSRITHRFVPFAKRMLHRVDCDISGCRSEPEVEDRVRSVTASIASKDLVKLVLTGSLSPELLLDPPRILTQLSERFYFAKLADETKLEIHPEEYAHDISLKGEFVRRVMALPVSEKQKEQIIACGFRALTGEELDL